MVTRLTEKGAWAIPKLHQFFTEDFLMPAMITMGILLVISLVAGGMYGIPLYKVYEQNLDSGSKSQAGSGDT